MSPCERDTTTTKRERDGTGRPFTLHRLAKSRIGWAARHACRGWHLSFGGAVLPRRCSSRGQQATHRRPALPYPTRVSVQHSDKEKPHQCEAATVYTVVPETVGKPVYPASESHRTVVRLMVMDMHRSGCCCYPLAWCLPALIRRCRCGSMHACLEMGMEVVESCLAHWTVKIRDSSEAH